MLSVQEETVLVVPHAEDSSFILPLPFPGNESLKILILFPLLCNLNENRISAQERHDADHDQVLQRHEHVQLEPEPVVESEDCSQAKVKPDAGRGEGQVGDVNADLDPPDEHEQNGSDAEQREGVGNNRWWPNFWFSELVLDFRLHGCLRGSARLKMRKLISFT